MIKPRAFTYLFIAVTAVATAAIWLIVEGVRSGAPLLVAGALLGVFAVLGIALLGRAVVLAERDWRRR